MPFSSAVLVLLAAAQAPIASVTVYGDRARVVTLPWGGVPALRDWWAVLGQSTPDLICSPQNLSLWALACRYGPPGVGWGLLIVALGTAALAAAARWAARAASEKALDTGTSAGLAATALVSPLGWWTNFIALAALVYGLLEGARRAGERRVRLAARAALLGLGAVAVLTSELISHDAFVFWLRQKHFGLTCLVAALVGLLVRAARYSQPITTGRAGT